MTIHELVYRRMPERNQGKPRGQASAISSYGFLLAYRTKLAWMLTLPSLIPSIVVFLVLYFTKTAASGNTGSMLNQLLNLNGLDDASWTEALAPYLRVFFQAQIWFVTFLAAFKGAPVISEDLAKHALDLYFSRPLSAATYVLGKLLTILRGLTLVGVIPMALSLLSVIALLPGFATHAWLLSIRVILAAVWMVVAYAVLAIGVSSFARSARYAVIAWFCLTFFSWVAGSLLAGATQTPALNYISFRHDVEVVIWWILGLPNADTASSEDPRLALLVLLGYYALGGFSLFRRMKKGILA